MERVHHHSVSTTSEEFGSEPNKLALRKTGAGGLYFEGTISQFTYWPPFGLIQRKLAIFEALILQILDIHRPVFLAELFERRKEVEIATEWETVAGTTLTVRTTSPSRSDTEILHHYTATTHLTRGHG